MHDENAGNLCHKFHTNATGPFTNFGEHSRVIQMPSKSPGFKPSDQQKLEPGKKKTNYQLTEAVFFMEPASSLNLVNSTWFQRNKLPTKC